MIYSHEVEMMCPVAQGANHGPAPIPEEAKWVKAKEVKDISGLDTRYWMVCSTAGNLQTDSECKRRYYPGSPC